MHQYVEGEQVKTLKGHSFGPPEGAVGVVKKVYPWGVRVDFETPFVGVTGQLRLRFYYQDGHRPGKKLCRCCGFLNDITPAIPTYSQFIREVQSLGQKYGLHIGGGGAFTKGRFILSCRPSAESRHEQATRANLFLQSMEADARRASLLGVDFATAEEQLAFIYGYNPQVGPRKLAAPRSTPRSTPLLPWVERVRELRRQGEKITLKDLTAYRHGYAEDLC